MYAFTLYAFTLPCCAVEGGVCAVQHEDAVALDAVARAVLKHGVATELRGREVVYHI